MTRFSSIGGADSDLFFRRSVATFCAVKRLSKGILIALALLVAIVLAALLSLNLYVQSPGTQARVQEELSKALGMPLIIRNTSLTPWGELKINGISIPTEEGNFLEAASVSARYRLLALFGKRLEIYDLRAERPQLVWRETAEGKYELPKREKITKPKVEGEIQPHREPRDLHVSVDGFKIQHGSLTFIDRNQQPAATFTEVELDFTAFSEQRLAGTLTIGQIGWKGVVFERVQTPFEFAEGKLTCPALAAAVADGALKATLALQPEKSDVPFSATLQIENLDLGRLMTETGWAPGQFAGKLRATLEATGALRKIVKVEGPGTLELTGGAVRQLELFRTIGDVLRVPQLSDLHLQDSRAAFHLGQEKVNFDEFALNSPDVQVTAKGPVRFNGKLALDARFGFSERVAAQLPDFVRETFTTRDPAGGFGLDFKVTGSLEKPKTDLLDRVVGSKLSAQFDDLVTSLFGSKKKKDEDKKNEEKKRKANPPKIVPPAPPPAVDPTATTVVPPAEPVREQP